MKKRVLILCTGNSCRSQMAEGIWRMLGGEKWECQSAGTRPAGYVHPLAIEVMRELGVHINHQQSKSLEPLLSQSFDVVVTVCDSANENCPVFPGATRMFHWPFDDPAHAKGTREEQLAEFRRVRDEIKNRIESYLR